MVTVFNFLKPFVRNRQVNLPVLNRGKYRSCVFPFKNVLSWRYLCPFCILLISFWWEQRYSYHIPPLCAKRLRWLVGIGKFMRPYLHNNSQECQCEWTIQLNICLLYWYFQQHQHCKNVLHNIRSLAWALIIVGPQATPQRAHALRLVQRYHLVGSSWLLVSLLNKCETLNTHSRAMTRFGIKSCGKNSKYFQFFC
jgi:hypothetical protein